MTDNQEDKEAIYRKLVRPKMMFDLKNRIIEHLLVKKKYKDLSYTAKQMAEDLGTNVRYISAVLHVEFHTNYTTLVNKYRIDEAKLLLTNTRYEDLNVEEIGDMVGFAHRQTFHTAFVKFTEMTPRAYREKYKSKRIPPSKKNKK